MLIFPSGASSRLKSLASRKTSPEMFTLTGTSKVTGMRSVSLKAVCNEEIADRILVPPGDPGSYKSPFLQDFIHLNVAMMTSNNALVPDPDKQDDLASQFWQWPILNVGLRMCGWDDSIVKYFLLGNPLVYWGSTASLGALALLVAWYLIRWQ